MPNKAVMEGKFRVVDEVRQFKGNPNAKWVRVSYFSPEHVSYVVGVAVDNYESREEAVKSAKMSVSEKYEKELAEGNKGVRWYQNSRYSDLINFRPDASAIGDLVMVRHRADFISNTDMESRHKIASLYYKTSDGKFQLKISESRTNGEKPEFHVMAWENRTEEESRQSMNSGGGNSSVLETASGMYDAYGFDELNEKIAKAVKRIEATQKINKNRDAAVKKEKKSKVHTEGEVDKKKVNALVHQALEQYNAASVEEKRKLKKQIEDNLARDKKGTDSIGFGLEKNHVEAGKIFLQKIENSDTNKKEKPMSNKLTKALNKAKGAVTKNKSGRKKEPRTKAGIAADKNIKAKHPGKRTSADGNTYFESRPNRSDNNRSKKFDDGGKIDSRKIVIQKLPDDISDALYYFDKKFDVLKAFSVKVMDGLFVLTDSNNHEVEIDNNNNTGNTKIYSWLDKQWDNHYGNPLQGRFADGGKPLGSTGLFADGGKPLGSTGLFSEGGSAYMPKIGDTVTIKDNGGPYDGHAGIIKEVFEENEEVDVVTAYVPDGILMRYEDVVPSEKYLDETYYDEFSLSGNGNRKYSLFGIHSSDQFRQAARKLFPGMSTQENKSRAKHFNELYQDAKREYQEYTDTEFKKHFGRPYEATDYKVSGIISNEFPEGVKSKIRVILKKEKEYNAARELHNSMLNKSDKQEDKNASAKFADGGKPLGSTGLFKHGGAIKYAENVYAYKADGEMVDVVAGSKEEAKELVTDKYPSAKIEFGREKKMFQGAYQVGVYNPKELSGIVFAAGGKPLGSTGLFAEGGKPLGSTGLFAAGGIPEKYDDPIAAHEIELYAENNRDLYRQRWIPILKNLKKKKDKGVFDVSKAAILMKYYVEDADKRYDKEHGSGDGKGFMLSVNDRKKLAYDLAVQVSKMSDADMTFARGGTVEETDLLNEADTVGMEYMDEVIENSRGFGYEEYYSSESQEVDHQSVSGFVPYTDGGHHRVWFEYEHNLTSMGKRLPTNTLQKQLEKDEAANYQQAKDWFKETYPEIVDEVGEDNIDYNTLYEKGYGSEAEELSEHENDTDGQDSIMFEVGYYFYNKNNWRGASEGKSDSPSCRVYALVNMEGPYHRSGNLEQYTEEVFEFKNLAQFTAKFKKAMDKMKTWMEGGSFDEGTELSIRRMAKGGTADDQNNTIADPEVVEMARGGATVARIANQEANAHSEHKLPFKGNNLEGKLLDNGDYVVLSYGYYPIWYWSSTENKWYGNATKYSPTTSKQLTQSRPAWDATMLEHNALLDKMRSEDARFDLGGVMIKALYPIGDQPMPTDNVMLAHGSGYEGIANPIQ